MKRNVTIAGAQYTGVPSVLIPLTGSNDKAVFCEVSDTTATAEDVANGKIFYTADGTATTGTATGGTAVTPQFKVNITQSDNQTISYNGITATAPTYSDGVIRITPDMFTANFIITPESGYDAGTLSEHNHKFSAWDEVVNISATAATKFSSTNKNRFVVNELNYNKAVNFVIDSTTYSIKGYNDTDYPLFLCTNLDYFKVNIAYNSTITQSMFNSGGIFYNYFNTHKLTIAREKDGYGLSWANRAPFVSYPSAYVLYTPYNATTVNSTTSGQYTIWQNLVASYKNGENLVVEFTD